MAINAHKKIKKAIEEIFSHIDICESKTKKYNLEETEKLMKSLSYFNREGQLLKEYDSKYLQYGIESIEYSNGLTLISSYMVLNGQFRIDQTIVTDNLNNKPLVILTNKYTLKTVSDYLTRSRSVCSVVGGSKDEEKSIEETETELVINDRYIGKFTKYGKKNCEDSTYAERYKPGHILSNWDLENNYILDKCLIGEIEILYKHDSYPVSATIYTNASEAFSLEYKGINPDPYTNPVKFIDKINKEVDLIIYTIQCEIKNYKNSHDRQNKKDEKFILNRLPQPYKDVYELLDEKPDKTCSSLAKIIDGEPVNINPLTNIPVPDMRLYYVDDNYFLSIDELLMYCRWNNKSIEGLNILDYYRNLAGRSDVIRKSNSKSSMLYTAVDRDGYGLYNNKRSVYRGKFTWEYNHGNIRNLYEPFRKKGVIFEDDVYKKIDESDQQVLKYCKENNLLNIGK